MVPLLASGTLCPSTFAEIQLFFHDHGFRTSPRNLFGIPVFAGPFIGFPPDRKEKRSPFPPGRPGWLLRADKSAKRLPCQDFFAQRPALLTKTPPRPRFFFPSEFFFPSHKTKSPSSRCALFRRGFFSLRAQVPFPGASFFPAGALSAAKAAGA